MENSASCSFVISFRKQLKSEKVYYCTCDKCYSLSQLYHGKLYGMTVAYDHTNI